MGYDPYEDKKDERRKKKEKEKQEQERRKQEAEEFDRCVKNWKVEYDKNLKINTQDLLDGIEPTKKAIARDGFSIKKQKSQAIYVTLGSNGYPFNLDFGELLVSSAAVKANYISVNDRSNKWIFGVFIYGEHLRPTVFRSEGGSIESVRYSAKSSEGIYRWGTELTHSTNDVRNVASRIEEACAEVAVEGSQAIAIVPTRFQLNRLSSSSLLILLIILIILAVLLVQGH